jgi:hypothetical protein
MSDLISRSALLDDMQKELEKAVNNENMTEFDCKVLMTSALALKNFVNRQPTAYDVEKVVAELEEEKTMAYDKCDGGSSYKTYSQAIDIVRKGGTE